jgi:hypothetical protein
MTTNTLATSVNFQDAEGAEFVKMVEDYNAAKALAKEMKAEQARLEALIRGVMGNADTAYVEGNVRASIVVRNRTNVNKEYMESEFPGVLEACTMNTIFTVLNAK